MQQPPLSEPMASSDVIDNERILLNQARDGDSVAQRSIYMLHIRYLTAVCSRYILNPEDVKDVLQDSFIKIFSALNTFEFRGSGSLRSWMSRIVVNESLKFLKRARTFEFAELTAVEDTIPFEGPDLDLVPTGVIYELIRQLPDGYRTIFNLYIIEGKSHKEIARMLNIKEGTSASQLHRAKAMLASRIIEYQSTFETLTVWKTNG